MRVGITYDLRDEYLEQGYGEEETAEFDKPETIDAIQGALDVLGFATERIGSAASLVHALAEGRRWEMVFNIAEGLSGLGRESLVPALLEAYDIPYTFSDPMVMGLCLHKGMCKHVIRNLGIPTADFRVVAHPEELKAVDLPFPLFLKPVAEGTGKGISNDSLVRDRRQLTAVCLNLLERFAQPVLVETYLPGRELTVGIVGTGSAARVIGSMEVIFVDTAEEIYSLENKEDYVRRMDYRLLEEGPLAQAVAQVALNAWRGLGCRDGGRIDVRLDAMGVPCFIEVNPLAGLGPVHSDLCIINRFKGRSYVDLIRDIVTSTLERVGHAHRRAA
jgi:D-alanine-D-alanine ligase